MRFDRMARHKYVSYCRSGDCNFTRTLPAEWHVRCHESVVYGQGCQEGQIVNEKGRQCMKSYDRGQGIVLSLGECIKKYAGPQPDVLEVMQLYKTEGSFENVRHCPGWLYSGQH